MRPEIGDQGRLFVAAARPQRRGEEARAATHQLEQVELQPGAAADADHDDPTGGREALQSGRQADGADELEHDVIGAARGDLGGRDDLGRAERGDRLMPGAVAHRGDHVGAGRRRELHGRAADAAGRARDQEALAEREARLAEERVEGGREDLHEAASLRPRQAGGDRQGVRLIDRGQRRLGAAADERHHAADRARSSSRASRR